MKTPFELMKDIDNSIFQSTKRTFKKKSPVQFEKPCPQCGNIGKVYNDDARMTFHCYSCGYVSPWSKVAGELREKKEESQFSEDYPLGGMIEPYDIEREKNL